MRVGNSDIKDILIGENPIVKIYKGLEVVWKRNELPDGYRQVAYLESTGTQYINTLIPPTTNTSVKCVVSGAHLGSSLNIALYGARTGASNQTNFALLNFSIQQKLRFDRGDYIFSGLSGSIQPDTFYEIYQDKNVNYVDGVEASKSNSTFSSVNLPIFIFGINDNGTYVKGGSWYEDTKRFKSFQIYESGTLIMDLIPCLDNNNRPCMYDRVTQRTFYNAGTGEFLYGEIN